MSKVIKKKLLLNFKKRHSWNKFLLSVQCHTVREDINPSEILSFSNEALTNLYYGLAVHGYRQKLSQAKSISEKERKV